MMNMFGTGPFITIPFLLASWDPPGPHALTGYSIATLVAICDSFVWAELSSLMPHSGGTYVYVRECFGKDTLGRVLAFFYLWQVGSAPSSRSYRTHRQGLILPCAEPGRSHGTCSYTQFQHVFDESKH